MCQGAVGADDLAEMNAVIDAVDTDGGAQLGLRLSTRECEALPPTAPKIQLPPLAPFGLSGEATIKA